MLRLRILYHYIGTCQILASKQLANLLHGRPFHVNLIPLNPVKESDVQPSTKEAVRKFQQILTQNGITATVRRRLGPDIDAACGQLRRRTIEEGEPK